MPLPACPACRAPLSAETFDGHYGRTVELDLCHRCNALWFDKLENLALSAGGLLTLLRSMHEAASPDRRPLPRDLACPRCAGPLRPARRRTRDLQYTVHECPRGHGHFLTFYELLREKGCIRPLTGKKLKELRALVSSVPCSSCGANVDLHRSAACDHCGAPLAMLDPEALDAALVRLASEAERKANPDGHRIAGEVLLQHMRTERTFAQHDRLERQSWGQATGTWGLLEWALGAVARALS